MEELRLPWNEKEGLLYGSVIALITAFLMSSINIIDNTGTLDLNTATMIVTGLPFIFVAVMILMSAFVGRVASALVQRFTEPTDGFYAKITFDIIFCVLMMSFLMSLIGPSIGGLLSGNWSMAIVDHWMVIWPRNFFFAFWIEMLIAQPAARYVMKHRHLRIVAAREVTA